MTDRVQEALQARRNALEGKRYGIVYYGCWHVIDNHGRGAWPFRTMPQVLDHAERLNAE